MLEECRTLDLLYVEDDLLLAKSTHETLQQFFNSVDVSYDGQEGFDSFKEAHYDIVLTDIMMPKLDGKEMSKKIKEFNPDQHIIVMSAHEDAEYLMELIEIGIHKFVKKPANIDRLFQALLTSAVAINNAKKITI